MKKNNLIYSYLSSLSKTIENLDVSLVEEFFSLVITTIRNNNVILLGNGGSWSNAVHGATDLNTAFEFINARSYAVAMGEDVANILRIANDKSFSRIFLDKIKLMLREGDLVVGLSTSGNSRNIINVFKFIKKNYPKINRILITADSGGKCKKFATSVLSFKVNNVQIAEDLQQIVFHIIYLLIMKKTYVPKNVK